MATIQRRLSLEDFLRLPEEKPALEFQDGVVTRKVSPKAQHGWLQYKLAELLNRFAVPRRQGRAFTETRATFGSASVVPDVVFYRWDRIPRDPNGRVANDFLLAPDIAVEIVSPGQSIEPLARRCRRYLQGGVSTALLVNPQDDSITMLGGDAPARVLHGADLVDLTSVLPGLEFTVHELFDSLRLD